MARMTRHDPPASGRVWNRARLFGAAAIIAGPDDGEVAVQVHRDVGIELIPHRGGVDLELAADLRGQGERALSR